MNKKLQFLLLFALLISTSNAESAEKNDPLSWDFGNTSLKIGGFLHVVVAEDFGGAVQNEDFIPSYAPVQDKWANENYFQITPSYSQLYLSVVHKSERLGDIKPTSRVTLEVQATLFACATPTLRRRGCL